MENTKMKYKIFFLMMLLVISLNNVSGYVIYEGELESTIASQTNQNIGFSSAFLYDIDEIAIKSGGLAGGLIDVSVMMDIAAWGGTHDYAYLKEDVIYEQSSVTVGTGYMYYWMMNIDDAPGYDKVYVKCVFDDGLDVPSGRQQVDIIGSITSIAKFDRSVSANLNDLSIDKQCTLGNNGGPNVQRMIEGYHSSRHINNFYNNYSYWFDETLFNFKLSRNVSNPSMLFIDNGYNELINETAYNDEGTYVYSDDLINKTWEISVYDSNEVTHNFNIDFIPTAEDLTPTLTTDKLLYNTSEQITISFTNIDEIEEYVGERLSLYILYPIVHESKDYDAKYMLHLLGDKRDETFTLNTSFLTPQNEYHLAICVDGAFHNIDDALIISDTFYVYDDNEYLTSSCNPEGNCYTYNNNDITIFYKINNNSDIIIKDNDGNTIQTYYNIIDEGEINYHIPNDENKLNSYHNWTIYLNNTGYETNYSTDVTVYWSLFVTPTPIPVYTVDIPDENVTEQIDQLKEESKPIFDLIYGLTTLVIDNPDYDNDNIIDEHEINNWFNSLIPLGILLLLVILYMGLKKRD